MTAPSQPETPRGRKTVLRVLIPVILAVLGAGGVSLYSKRAIIVKMREVVRASAQLAQEAANAPGAAELRQLGCHKAAVMDMRRIYEATGITDAGAAPSLHVLCNIRFGQAEPSCRDVAATYVAAVGQAPSSFTAVVRREETNQHLCEVVFEADGAPGTVAPSSGGTAPTAQE